MRPMKEYKGIDKSDFLYKKYFFEKNKLVIKPVC